MDENLIYKKQYDENLEWAKSIRKMIERYRWIDSDFTKPGHPYSSIQSLSAMIDIAPMNDIQRCNLHKEVEALIDLFISTIEQGEEIPKIENDIK